MYNQIIRCYKYDLLNFKAKLGAMYYCIDTRTLYKDNGNNIEQRLRFNAVIVTNDGERLNIKPVIGKFYYVEENNTLWLFDGRWIIKIGNTTEYNAFSYDNGVASPVINEDNYITGKYGDRIIDNNGLLGDGSIVVRDDNKLIKSRLAINNVTQELMIQSFVNDGILLIPNAHIGITDLSTSLGSLHLTVKKELNDNSSVPAYSGQAFFYGEWNTYGSINNIVKINDTRLITANYIPSNDNEIVKLVILCNKHSIINNEEKLIKTYIIIRPLSDHTAIIQILSLYDEDSTSVVMNDMGELIYTNSGMLLDNSMLEVPRTTYMTDDNIIHSDYELSNYGVTIKTYQDNGYINYSIPDIWSDTETPFKFETQLYEKHRVLTSKDNMSNDNFIHRIK